MKDGGKMREGSRARADAYQIGREATSVDLRPFTRLSLTFSFSINN
jgi:hypothetical protein